MPVSGAVSTFALQDRVRILPWVDVEHVRQYWGTVNAPVLEQLKGRVFRISRLDDDGIYGLYALLAAAGGTGVGTFWVKTCLLTLADNPELV